MNKFKRLGIGLLVLVGSQQAWARQDAGTTINNSLQKYRHVSMGTVYITATDSVRGKLTYDEVSDKLSLVQEGKDRKFNPNEVLGFRLDSLDQHYESQATADVVGGGSKSFYLNLTPNKGQRLKVYRSLQLDADLLGTKIVGGDVVGSYEYGVLLPGTTKVTGITQLKLTPYYKKMPAYVKDCPALAEKITAKQQGYTYGKGGLGGLMTPTTGEIKRPVDDRATNEALQVMLRIAQEYNACK